MKFLFTIEGIELIRSIVPIKIKTIIENIIASFSSYNPPLLKSIEILSGRSWTQNAILVLNPLLIVAIISVDVYGWKIRDNVAAESDDVSRVGSVAIFFIEPIRTIKGGISNQILKLKMS